MPPKERSPLTPWPLWPMQLRIEGAHEEGGIREWSVATTKFTGDENGHVKQLHGVRVDAPDPQLAIERLAAGDYLVQKRMTLEAWTTRHPEPRWRALNDVVLHKGGFARVVRLNVFVDGNLQLSNVPYTGVSNYQQTSAGAHASTTRTQAKSLASFAPRRARSTRLTAS